MSRENQRIKLTKMLLKNSFISLLKVKPVSQISVKEICEQADLNRSTFYHHYQDAFQFLDAIEQEVLAKTADYLEQIKQTSDTLDYLTTFLKYIKDNREIFFILLCKQENQKFQIAFIHKTMEHIKDTITFTYSTEYEKYLFGFLFQGCSHIIREWILADFDIPADKMADIILSLVMHTMESWQN